MTATNSKLPAAAAEEMGKWTSYSTSLEELPLETSQCKLEPKTHLSDDTKYSQTVLENKPLPSHFGSQASVGVPQAHSAC